MSSQTLWTKGATSRYSQGDVSIPVQEIATIRGTTPSQSPDFDIVYRHRIQIVIAPVTYVCGAPAFGNHSRTKKKSTARLRNTKAVGADTSSLREDLNFAAP